MKYDERKSERERERDSVAGSEKPHSGVVRCTVNDLKFVLNDRDNCLFAGDRWVKITGVRSRRT